jgi:energy-coupling factor transporter ATP-binding protein EcfA2
MTSAEITNRLDDIVDFSGLGQFIDTPVKNYSSGMTVRLGFAVATSVDPEILVIDEVLAVGDASFQQRCFERIESFRKDGRTIILVSHGLAQVTQLCDKAAWIEKGELKALGPSLEVVSDYTGTSYNAQPKAEGEIGERWGTGEADITKVELLDEEGHERTAYVSGKSFTIRIHTDAHVPLKDPVIGLRITDLHGHPVWGSNTRRRAFSIPSVHGAAIFQFEIPELPLLEGTYELSVALADMSEVHVYDHWERKIRFNVHQFSSFDEGLIVVEGNWKAC